MPVKQEESLRHEEILDINPSETSELSTLSNLTFRNDGVVEEESLVWQVTETHKVCNVKYGLKQLQ